MGGGGQRTDASIHTSMERRRIRSRRRKWINEVGNQKDVIYDLPQRSLAPGPRRCLGQHVLLFSMLMSAWTGQDHAATERKKKITVS